MHGETIKMFISV